MRRGDFRSRTDLKLPLNEETEEKTYREKIRAGLLEKENTSVLFTYLVL